MAHSSLNTRVPQLERTARSSGPREGPAASALLWTAPMVVLISCLVAAINAQDSQPSVRFPVGGADQQWTVTRGKAVPDPSAAHAGDTSLRLEAAAGIPGDAGVSSAPMSLTIGRRYELSGWVRTDGLTVRDLDRSPIGSGAMLTMASMPFDVHSASAGGTRDWTRLVFRFVASRAQDAILLTAGRGGVLGGRAWFAGVRLDEASSADEWPAKEAVRTFGPAYRYPARGWIYLHVEGRPYDRGYQHGYLMAREIPEYLERCAYELGGKADARSWDPYRTAASALFLRGFDREILEEMRGIAEGANANGAKWLDRPLDLTDIVVANTVVELGELREAVNVTPTGLEGLRFDPPPYARRPPTDRPPDHCSAFAATGEATRDGKMVVGHVTWWSLTLAEQTNVMLDIRPDTGHRLLMQSYPGGIESGTDWYQNDAGVVLTETTIRQTPFHIEGTPVAFRARRAIQYGGDIDSVVRELGTRNNGLYSNEWIIGDAKTNEIAMYELGTRSSRLWRSSKKEWFGETPGFYWGDNNAKDLAVRLETQPDPQGTEYVPYVPAERDLAWQGLYRRFKGRIDEQFAFLAFRSAPLVSVPTVDAKVTSADMASRLMVWAQIGRPNESAWVPQPAEGGPNRGLYPGGYHLFAGEPSDALRRAVQENERARVAGGAAEAKPPGTTKPVSYKDRLWKGWVLPASAADVWLAAGSAAYHHALESEDPPQAIEAQRIRYRGLLLAPDTAANRFGIERAKGLLFLDGLRRKMGDEGFLALMTEYFAANATKAVTARSFLDKAGTAFEAVAPGDGPAYLPVDIGRRLASAVIVYGTRSEAGANRYAAELLQRRYRDEEQVEVPIARDFEVTDHDLEARDVVFVGRPETNSAVAAWAAGMGLDYDLAAFRLGGKTYASERNALVFAAKNPLDPAHLVLLFAGNSPLQTVRSLNQGDGRSPSQVLEDAKPVDGGRP